MKSIYSKILPAALLLGAVACKDNNPADNTGSAADTAIAVPAAAIPAFNPDTAYSYVAAQVAFGPRVPGSPAQRSCAGWMESKLRASCDTVYRQSAMVTGGDKK